MSRRWKVTAPWDFAAIAAQSGTPLNVLHAALGGSRCDVGFVSAPTKGAAIVAAHEAFPKIPVADLLVKEMPERLTTDERDMIGHGWDA